MHHNYPNLVIAYHGCDRRVRDEVVMGGNLIRSENPYDWLGNGIYFWENDRQRAFEWALSLKEKERVDEPSVIGAVLDLGNCLNLLEREYVEILAHGYELLKRDAIRSGVEIPRNLNIKNNNDWLLRNLDCAVIEQIHMYNRMCNLPPYDSVRSLFEEGEAVYPGSGFRRKTHIQICVINPNCIIGFFIPRDIDSNFPQP